MRISILVLVISSVVLKIQAQSYQRESLVGIWICKEATLLTGEITGKELEAVKQLGTLFRLAKFKFNANGVFVLEFTNSASPLVKQLNFLNNKEWTINPETNTIRIGSPRENLMQIELKNKEGVIYFILSETPLLLLMEKE
jgi:hypothetical protein